MRFASLIMASAIVAGCSTEATAQRLTAHWGLQSDVLYEEAREVPGSTSAVKSQSRKPATVRAFRIREPQYGSALMSFLQRHNQLVPLYRKTLPPPGSAITREQFVSWAKDQDPVYIASGRRLAPVLYFDFIGGSGKEYVLTRIDVKTIAFEEYSGGGFFDQQAWYDIELSKDSGSKTYQVDRKLRFTGTGRAEIRFLSGNYYPSSAMTPLGSYLISMRFVFLVDGKEVVFDTGKFRVDA
jgi:hypothetical protein